MVGYSIGLQDAGTVGVKIDRGRTGDVHSLEVTQPWWTLLRAPNGDNPPGRRRTVELDATTTHGTRDDVSVPVRAFACLARALDP